MPKISIIVPVYKVEKYLKRCLDSIRAQTFIEWECILIDDGSPDKSGIICDEYSEKDSRFIVIHQKNAGSAEARNVGLKNARGKYIICVDADDWIEKKYLEELYNVASLNDADVVGCNLIREYPRKSIVVKILMPETNKDCISSLLTGQLQGFLHVKLIKKSLIIENNITFVKDINMWEDLIFSVKVFYYAEKIFRVESELYHYRYNPISLTNTFGESRARDLKGAADEIENFLNKQNISSFFQDDLLALKTRVKSDILFESKKDIKKKYISIYPEVDEILYNKKMPVLKKIALKLVLNGKFFIGNFILTLLKIRRNIINKVKNILMLY